MNLLLLIIVILIICGTLPVFPYSRGWGYTPVGLILLILLVLVLLGYRI